jgi:uncharacterized membrane protein
MASARILKVSRLENLTDGIFAIAMTILILNVVLPDSTTSTTLWFDLKADIFQKLFIYVGSFIILGTYWVGMDFQHGFLSRLTRPYLWLNIVFLMATCVLPFSASMLARFPHHEVSFNFFTVNLLIMSLLELILWTYAQKSCLTNDAAKISAVNRSIYRRILIAPTFYFVALVVALWNVNAAFFLLIIPPIVHIVPGAVDKYSETNGAL